MGSQLPLTSDDDDTTPLPLRSGAYWWRSLPEFDSTGHITAAELTPRLRVIRELQRIAFVADEGGLDSLRQKLTSYKAGDLWVPVGGIKKEEMDIPAVITLMLVGLVGAGKSSVVNFMYSVLGRSGLIPFAQTSCESCKYTTMFMEEHNILRSMKSGFCVYDTRGLDCDRMDEGMAEVSSWMSDGVRHNQSCCRDDEIGEIGESMVCSAKYCKRRVNCVMVVANLEEANDDFKCGDLKHVEAIKTLFHSPSIRRSNENPLLIMTHGDMLTPEDRIESRVKLCNLLGISETTGAYEVACVSEKGILPEDGDPVSAFALTEAIYRSLIQSDRTHLPKKSFKDWILICFSWFLSCLGAFFALLASFFSKFGHSKHKKLKLKL